VTTGDPGELVDQVSGQPSLVSVAAAFGSVAGSQCPLRTHWAGPWAVPDLPLAQIDQNS
jgi:hypothetical protein